MLSFSNYENFENYETQHLKDYLNDNKDNNTIANLQTEPVEYLFKTNKLNDTMQHSDKDTKNEQLYKHNNQNQDYTNSLS
jgi:hypothetical protein